MVTVNPIITKGFGPQQINLIITEGFGPLAESGHSDLFATFTVSQGYYDLFAKFTVINKGYEDLYARLSVRHSAAEDLYAEFFVQTIFTRDLFAEFTVRQRGIRDLYAELTVIHPYATGLHAEFIVRHSDLLDLHAEAVIRGIGTSDLLAEFEVLNVGSQDLAAKFLLRQLVLELPAYFTVQHSTIFDLFAEFIVRGDRLTTDTFRIYGPGRVTISPDYEDFEIKAPMHGTVLPEGAEMDIQDGTKFTLKPVEEVPQKRGVRKRNVYFRIRRV